METVWRSRKLQIWVLLSAQADEEYLSVASQLPGKPRKLGQMQPPQAWITSPTPDSSIDNNVYTHQADPAPRQHHDSRAKTASPAGRLERTQKRSPDQLRGLTDQDPGHSVSGALSTIGVVVAGVQVLIAAEASIFH
jgi:hypothetical protein